MLIFFTDVFDLFLELGSVFALKQWALRLLSLVDLRLLRLL